MSQIDDKTQLEFDLANERWKDAVNTFHYHMNIAMNAVKKMNAENKILFKIEQEFGIKREIVEPIK